jgi:hypothetical protein
MVRVQVDAADTPAFRAYCCRVPLNKGTQAFHVRRYPDRNISDLFEMVIIIVEDIFNILPVTC